MVLVYPFLLSPSINKIVIMGEIEETIKEAIEKAEESSINSRVAIIVSLVATFMALCNIKNSSMIQSMSRAQAHSIDAWSYYQAKGTKENLEKNTIDLLKLQSQKVSDVVLKSYEDRIAKYEKEKEEIKKQAEGYEKQYDEIHEFNDQFEITEALLSISIALFGITALTQKKWLFGFAVLLSLTGVVLGTTAFFKISLLGEWVAKLLG